MSTRITVPGDAPYDVVVGRHLLGELPGMLGDKVRKVLLVHPGALATSAEAMREDLAGHGYEVILAEVPEAEESKTAQVAAFLWQVLGQSDFTRSDAVVSLGGGATTDLAGFVAATWLRGVAVVHVPTTLLGMVDAAVGGKTGINTAEGKNLVGAFHPPVAVFADTATLRTLPPRELRAGLAEVVKYGAIGDAPFLDWLEAHAGRLLGGDDAALREAIARSCQHKAAIVARDPFEHGERALLNFGHTFAHAIETAQGYGGLNHGEAVAVGMVLAARLSERLGLAPIADGDRLQALLARFGLPVHLPAGLDPQRLLDLMRLDKKARADGLRFIGWNGAGRARILGDVPEEAVLDVLR